LAGSHNFNWKYGQNLAVFVIAVVIANLRSNLRRRNR